MANATVKPLEERLIDKAYELEEQYRLILEQRAANRSSLRDLVKGDMLTPEQAALVDEIYPERAPRGSNSGQADSE